MKGKKRISVVDFLLRAFNISFTMKALHPFFFIASFIFHEATDRVDNENVTIVILEHEESHKVVAINTKDDKVTLEARD